MQQGTQGAAVDNFPNVVPLEKIAPSRPVQVDVPDTAPPADAAEQGLTERAAPALPKPVPAPKPAAPSSTHGGAAAPLQDKPAPTP